MGKRMSVTTLPQEVLDELQQRLVKSNFGSYEAHAEWLREKGFPISKSAIHRYATEHASGVLAKRGGTEGLSPAEARLRCLEIAASVGHATSPTDLIDHAEELLQWVYTY